MRSHESETLPAETHYDRMCQQLCTCTYGIWVHTVCVYALKGLVNFVPRAGPHIRRLELNTGFLGSGLLAFSFSFSLQHQQFTKNK